MVDPDLAPIVLFAYNRPWHTRQTLEALMANELADKSRLIIYCDGPKPGATPEQIQKTVDVRKLVREKSWCSTVEIIESDKNKGLAPSVITGVTEVINRYGKIIVLEDDLVTSPYFLRYMNEGLEIYEPVKNVYSVNGFMFPVEWEGNHTILLPYTSTWGWATWKDKWIVFDASMPEKASIQENTFLSQRFNLADYDYTAMLNFGNNSWGIKWYYTVFRQNGLGLFPTKSLIKNIGFDGSGVNCGETEPLESLFLGKIVIEFQYYINLEFYGTYLKYFEKKKIYLLTRIINRLKRIIE
jgi:hypothetical protein